MHGGARFVHHGTASIPHRVAYDRNAGAKQGIEAKNPTIAELLKPMGYATAQIGKNHLGDRNEYLPTVHGFDYFYGNLYHLNAEEEPEDPDYPKGSQVSQNVWAARRSGVLCHRSRRPNGTPSLGPCGQADGQRYRTHDS